MRYRVLSVVFAALLLACAGWAQQVDPVEHAVELLRQNRVAEARVELQAVLERDPGNTQAAAYLVTAEIEAGETESAVARARRLAEAEPDNTDFQTLLAQAYGANSDWPLAEKQWRLVTERRPGSEGAHFEYGRVLLQMARFDDGLREVNRALEIDPNRTDVRALKGNLLASLGKMDEAVREWSRVLGVDPNNPAALSGLAVYLKDSNPDLAVEYARRAVELTNWQSIGAIRVLALVYRTRGETAKAREVLEKAVRKFPDDPVLAAELKSLSAPPAGASQAKPAVPPAVKKPPQARP